MSRFGGVILAAMAMAATIPAVWAQAPAPTDPQAQQNVRESQQYERLLCTNAAFRAKRIAQECGSLQGSQFYESCVASFNCNSQPAVHPRRTPPSEKIR